MLPQFLHNLVVMKVISLLICFWCICFSANSQTSNTGDYEVKVFSYTYKTTKGHLKKVTPEGVGIEDYQGNYFIFRTKDIIKIKVKRRGLTFGQFVSGGTLAGLGIGAAIWSLDEQGENTTEMAKLTAALTVAGALVGTAVGGVAAVANKKMALRVNGSQSYFLENHKKLEKYVNHSQATQHVANY